MNTPGTIPKSTPHVVYPRHFFTIRSYDRSLAWMGLLNDLLILILSNLLYYGPLKGSTNYHSNLTTLDIEGSKCCGRENILKLNIHKYINKVYENLLCAMSYE